MDLPVRIDTAVIGAGHNGLAMSRLLSLRRPRPRRARAAGDARRRLAGPLGRVPARLAELDDGVPGPAVRRATSPTRSCPATTSSRPSAATPTRSARRS